MPVFLILTGEPFRWIEWVGEVGVVSLPKVALNFRNLQKYFNFTLTTAMISANIKNCDKRKGVPKLVPGRKIGIMAAYGF